MKNETNYPLTDEEVEVLGKGPSSLVRRALMAQLLEAAVKPCNKCDTLLPLDAFTTAPSSAGGYYASCKKCRNTADREGRQTAPRRDVRALLRSVACTTGRPELLRELHKQGKKYCSCCDTVKTLDDFAANSSAWDGLTSRCRSCFSAYHKERRKAAPKTPFQIEMERHRRDRQDNPEKYRQLQRQRGRHWRKNNPEKRAASKRRYYQQNPEQKTAEEARRRARKAQALAPGAIASAINQFYRVRPIIELLLGEACHVDHQKPLARGGLHHQDNLQILPARLNLEKSDRTDWTPPENVFEKVTILAEEPKEA